MERILKQCCLLWLLIVSCPLFAAEDIWPALKSSYFADRPIHDAKDWLLLLIPENAEDSSIVPVSITSQKPQTQQQRITALHLIIDNNPMPHAAKFSFSEHLNTIDISTRIRVDKFSYIRVIAEMSDGSLHMTSKFIQAAGGCSAPASKDSKAALARIGKMQIRMREPIIGKPNSIQVMISHPNNSGLQIDHATRGYIPPHYVKEMTISYNQQPLIRMDAGISISEDPSLRFVFTPTQKGVLKAKVIDSKNVKFSKEKTF